SYTTSISCSSVSLQLYIFFCFHPPSPTHLYTLSLHDALPIWRLWRQQSRRRQSRHLDRSDRWQSHGRGKRFRRQSHCESRPLMADRKSTRLNSSHQIISYAVFCLKKKKKQTKYKEVS